MKDKLKGWAMCKKCTRGWPQVRIPMVSRITWCEDCIRTAFAGGR